MSDERFAPARALLRSTSIAALCAARPPSTIVTLQASMSCGAALRALAQHSIGAAPVLDEEGAFLGFVTESDVMAQLLASTSDLSSSETTQNTQYVLRAAGLQLEHLTLAQLNLAQDGALIYKADLSQSLLDVSLFGFLRPNAAGALNVVHRVGVFDAEEDSEDVDMDGSEPQLRGIRISHVISQGDVVRFLHKHVAELGPLADASLGSLGLGAKPVVCVPAEMSTINAFASMLANKVSCVGVVSHREGGRLAGSLSSSDLRGLLPQHFVSLASPVLQFLTAKASAGWGLQQPPQHAAPAQPLPPDHTQQRRGPAPGGAQSWGVKGREGLKQLQLVTCSLGSSLREVLGLLCRHHLHHLHVTDERQRPVGVVTCTDLLAAIVGGNELLQAIQPDLEVEQEVEQRVDCECGMEPGQELVEAGKRGILAVASQQQLLNAA